MNEPNVWFALGVSSENRNHLSSDAMATLRHMFKANPRIFKAVGPVGISYRPEVNQQARAKQLRQEERVLYTMRRLADELGIPLMLTSSDHVTDSGLSGASSNKSFKSKIYYLSLFNNNLTGISKCHQDQDPLPALHKRLECM